MGHSAKQRTDSPQKCDVLVIGGGPAGSAISALLAEKGWHVQNLEKDKHPRFHIGESLLPYTLPFLNRLGVLQKVDKIGLRKYGIELLSPDHADPMTLYFSQANDPSFSHAYQVRRSEFDQILLENAAEKGAIVNEGWRVVKVAVQNGSRSLVTAINTHNTTGTWEASYVVDATGRDSFLSQQSGSKKREAHHNSAAIFGHFEGVQRNLGLNEGNITIGWFKHGWIWMIPFKDGITSVGAVCWPSYLKTRKSELDQFLWDTLALCRPLFPRFKDAKLIIPAMTTGNYSYRSTEQLVGANHIIVGDAWAFIDPVFSTGIHLALQSAILGADVIDAHLKNSPDSQRSKEEFEQKVRRSLEIYSWFIYRFTQPAFQQLFMSTRNIIQVKETILSLLAGNVFPKTPNRLPIFLFKTLYYIFILLSPMNNLKASRQRALAVNKGAGLE